MSLTASSNETQKPFFNTLAARFLGSGLAGCSEMTVFYPLDTSSKRLMHDRCSIKRCTVSNRLKQIHGCIFRDAVGKSFLTKVHSLYAGFGIATVYKVSQRSYQFGSQPYFRDILVYSGYQDMLHKRWGTQLGEVCLSSTAALFMGIGEVLFVPINSLKIKAQTEPSTLKGRSLINILRSQTVPQLFKGGRPGCIIFIKLICNCLI
eukprot:GHVL01020621.1.p1 GENE.GHVL01020621.1~~GHVL01020621.1.p1  ORF type:complete len:206 (+),score=20.72 GHVL01020621.1:43-660(+)